MTAFAKLLLSWAARTADDVLLLAHATGALEGWLRGEAAIAVQKGGFGAFDEVTAERGHVDLVVCQEGASKAVEFKVAFNNKNLIGGYNGTRGIAQDVAKLSQLTFDEKYLAVLFAFYSRTVYPDLKKFYGQQVDRVRLQPKDGEDFGTFAADLARQVTRKVISKPEEVRPMKSDGGVWLGFWCQRVSETSARAPRAP
jgi:hypothetical protein